MTAADRIVTPAGAITLEREVTQSLGALRVGLTLRLFRFAGLLLVAQTILLLALFARSLELVAYLEAHLLCCAASIVYLSLRHGWGSRRPVAELQMVGWTALAGPFGTFAALALTLPRSSAVLLEVMPERAPDRSADERSATERIERMHTVLRDRRVRLDGARSARPLIDVIVEGSRSEKLEALSVAYRKYEARMGILLKRALQDHDTSVRVLAATVTAKLHATYGRKIGDRQQAAGSDPDNARHWRQLGESRLAYAESSLLEGPRARAQLEAAITELSRAVELDPTDATSITCLNRARRLAAYGGRD